MKTVVVTGGMRRVGLVISNRLRESGWRVITTSHRLDSGADVIADFRDAMGAAKAYAAILGMNGGMPPDALVNNAALFVGDVATLKAVNVMAPKKLTMLMAGRETGCGTVVNVLDCRVLGRGCCERRCGAGGAVYDDTKLELLEYTRKSAVMFSDTLRVNAVAPGPVMAPEEVMESAGDTPLGRPSAEAVADAIAWLLGADFTSGCIIPVDGGQSLSVW